MVHLLVFIVNICKMRGTHRFKIVNWMCNAEVVVFSMNVFDV
jgi:hypothetical protein